MESVDMRAALKEAGKDVPRSNEDVEKAYLEMTVEDRPKPEGELVTYIGSGDEPPHMIDFMGRQKFVRGQSILVTDPVVLAKIPTHKCFVFGEVNQDELFKQDDLAKKRAAKQRQLDAEKQAEAILRNKK